jgi:hypothetical protein
MAYFVKNSIVTPDTFAHVYSGISKEDLCSKLNDQLISLGYTLVEGSIGNGTYEKGNRTMRILFGAFVKYFKFRFLVSTKSETEAEIQVVKQTSGFSGGAIGISQVKSELGRLSALLQLI